MELQISFFIFRRNPSIQGSRNFNCNYLLNGLLEVLYIMRYSKSRFMFHLQLLVLVSDYKGEMRNIMQYYYKEENLYNLINSTIHAVEMKNELKQDESGINMTYNFITNCVGFDATRLVEAWKEIEAAIPLDQYVKALTMHELGHAMDREALQQSLDRTLEIMKIKNSHSEIELYTNEQLLAIIIEEHEMNIIFEETAWNNAKQLNQKAVLVDEVTFELIKNHSLATYRELYEEDLLIYEKVKERHLQTV